MSCWQLLDCHILRLPLEPRCAYEMELGLQLPSWRSEASVWQEQELVDHASPGLHGERTKVRSKLARPLLITISSASRIDMRV